MVVIPEPELAAVNKLLRAARGRGVRVRRQDGKYEVFSTVSLPNAKTFKNGAEAVAAADAVILVSAPPTPRPPRWPLLPVHDDGHFRRDPATERCRMSRGVLLQSLRTGQLNVPFCACNRRWCFGCGARLAREDKTRLRCYFKHALSDGGTVYFTTVKTHERAALSRKLARRINEGGGGVVIIAQPGDTFAVFASVPLTGAEQFDALDVATQRMVEVIDQLPPPVRKKKPLNFAGQWRSAEEEDDGEPKFLRLGSVKKGEEEVVRVLERHHVPQAKPEIRVRDSVVSVVAWDDLDDQPKRLALLTDILSPAPEPAVSESFSTSSPTLTDSDTATTSSWLTPRVRTLLERFDEAFRPTWTTTG
jgi:hypothetical protein